MNAPTPRRLEFHFAQESLGDPLGSFPSLVIEDRAYNLWLADHILDPVLDRWSRNCPSGGGDGAAAAIANDITWASGSGRRAFQEIAPVAARLGDPALLAALGVTANLHRTLALLAEFILDDDRPASPPGSSFRLSRFFCGLIDYPKNSPYFPARIHPPAHADRLQPRRLDPRHLGNALWCSVGDINRRCDEALEILRRELPRSGFWTQENRSGGVRLRNSSM